MYKLMKYTTESRTKYDLLYWKYANTILKLKFKLTDVLKFWKLQCSKALRKQD